MPSTYEFTKEELWEVERNFRPIVTAWRRDEWQLDLNALLTSVYLQGVLDGGFAERECE